MKKLLTYSAALVSAITLIGCGGGSDNSAPPAGTKATITIGNNSTSTYTRAVLLDQNGKEILSQNLGCEPAQKDCEFYLPNELNDQLYTLIVQDSQSRLNRAFQATGTQLVDWFVYPSRASTGFYLTELLKKNYLSKESIPADEVYLRIQQFFLNYQSLDRLANFDEEVGDYYSKKRNANPTLTTEEFLDAFAKRLKNWDVATPEELPATSVVQARLSSQQKLATALGSLISGKSELIGLAYAQEAGGCSADLQGLITVVGSSVESIPIVGGVVSGFLGIAKDSCSTTDSQLAGISSQLDTLQNSVDTVAQTLAQAKSLSESGWINAETQKFKEASNAVRYQMKLYKDFLDNNKINGQRVATLEEWFNQKGGYAQVKASPSWKSVLEVLTSMKVVIETMTAITTDANLKTYYEALNNRCKSIDTNSNKKGSNFIAERQSCNNAVLVNIAYLMGSEAMVQPMAKDIFAVLSKYNTGENPIYNDVKYPVVNQALVSKKASLEITSYVDAYEKTKEVFTFQQQEFANDLKTLVGHDGKGYFNAFAGLPDPLVKRIANICGVMFKQNAPAIVGWYSPKGEERDRYIVTECQLANTNVGATPFQPVKAKYYYAMPDAVKTYTSLTNVMGVLADAREIQNSDNDDSAQGVIWERYSSSAYNFIFEAPKLFAYSHSTIQKGTYIPSYSDPIFKTEQMYLDTSFGVGYYFAKIESSAKSTPNWLLFKDDEGYYYTVLMGLEGSGKPVSLYCRTPDCGVGPGKEWLTFKDSKLIVDISDMNKKISGYPVLQLGPLK